MKLTTRHDQLTSCLDYVISVVPSSKTDTLMSHVLIRAEKGTITIAGTNHQVQMTASCSGKSKQSLERIVPADKLRRILSTISPEAEIEMDFSEQEVVLTAGRSTFKLMTQKTDNFSLLGETSEMKELEKISCEDLMAAINQVHYSAAEDSHRRHLTGVLLNRTKTEIDFVATDGHRMAIKTLKRSAKDTSTHLLPIKTVQTLAKHLSGSGEEVQLSANDRVICFKTEKFELVSNTIQESYPDYQSVIPTNNKTQAIVECNELKKSLDRVVALSDQRATTSLEFEENKLRVSGNNADNDSLTDWLDIKYDSEKMTMVFNVLYLAQFLNACKETIVEINMSSEENGVLMRPVGEDESLIYIVMPVRT